jgi:hypothetical protein
MENSSHQKNLEKKVENSLIKKVILHLDTLFIIDKAFELLMVFIGLFAAISVDGYMEKKSETTAYISYLSKLHTELSNNAVLIEGYNKSIENYIEIWSETSDNFTTNNIVSSPGFQKMYSSQPIPLENRIFSTLDKDGFQNKRLLADLFRHYGQEDEIKQNMNEAENMLSEFYTSYYNVYAGPFFNVENNVEDKIKWNLLFSKFGKFTSLKIQPIIADYEITNERILEEIEIELDGFGKKVEDIRDQSDYYWLSYYALLLENNDDCIEFGKIVRKLFEFVGDSIGLFPKSCAPHEYICLDDVNAVNAKKELKIETTFADKLFFIDSDKVPPCDEGPP